jgi:hypothetical protein
MAHLVVRNLGKMTWTPEATNACSHWAGLGSSGS